MKLEHLHFSFICWWRSCDMIESLRKATFYEIKKNRKHQNIVHVQFVIRVFLLVAVQRSGHFNFLFFSCVFLCSRSEVNKTNISCDFFKQHWSKVAEEIRMFTLVQNITTHCSVHRPCWWACLFYEPAVVVVPPPPSPLPPRGQRCQYMFYRFKFSLNKWISTFLNSTLKKNIVSISAVESL